MYGRVYRTTTAWLKGTCFNPNIGMLSVWSFAYSFHFGIVFFFFFFGFLPHPKNKYAYQLAYPGDTFKLNKTNKNKKSSYTYTVKLEFAEPNEFIASFYEPFMSNQSCFR